MSRFVLSACLVAVIAASASCCPVTTCQKWFGGGPCESSGQVAED